MVQSNSTNPALLDLQNNQKAGMKKSLRMECVRLAVAAGMTKKQDIMDAASSIYKYVEYGTVSTPIKA